MGEEKPDLNPTLFVIGLFIGATLAGVVAVWFVGHQSTDCTPHYGPAPDGCYPCHDAMNYHATQWANGNGDEDWHLERRDHWKKANQLGADCSDWKRVDNVEESS